MYKLKKGIRRKLPYRLRSEQLGRPSVNCTKVDNQPEITLVPNMSTLVECCFSSTETVGLLGTGAQDGHLDFTTAPELSPTLTESYL